MQNESSDKYNQKQVVVFSRPIILKIRSLFSSIVLKRNLSDTFRLNFCLIQNKIIKLN